MFVSENASSVDASSSLDRLEYGKFCLSTDGPIEPGADHQTLGYSSGFPQELIRHCNPSGFSLGINNYEMESENLLVGDRRVGVVIRPVRHQGRFGRLAYRLGIRSEGGQKETRYYTVARYLFDASASGGLYPIYNALGSLEGTTRSEKIEPLAVTGIGLSTLEITAYRDFLDGALDSVMSGLPVEIESESEQEFFSLVDCIRTNLPLEAQPLLSAGWNVSSTLADSLCFSATPRIMSVNARYDTRLRKWQRRPLRTSEVPGIQYRERRLNTRPLRSDEVIARLQTAPADESRNPMGLDQLPDCPGFNDSATREFFRGFGGYYLNEQVFEIVQDWLRGANIEWGDKLPQVVRRIRSSAFLNSKLLELFRKVPEEQIVAQRTDELALVCLHMDPKVFDPRAHEVSSRFRFFAAVLDSDAPGALEHYASLAATEENWSLPPGILEQFVGLLPQTFGAACVAWHAKLLGWDEAYNGWLTASAEAAATEWAAIIATEIPRMLQVLVGLLPNGSSQLRVSVLAAFASGSQAPPEADRILRALSPKDKSRLAKNIEARWQAIRENKNVTPSDPENIAEWAQFFSFEVFEDAMLRMAAGGRIDDISQLFGLLCQIDIQTSRFLRQRLSQELSRLVPQETTFVTSHWEQFHPLLAIWPEDALNVFFGFRALPPIDRALVIDSINIVPNAQAFRSLWQLWRGWEESVMRSRAIATICDWCLQKLIPDPTNPPFVRALQTALLGSWDEGPAMDWKEAAEAMEMLTLGNPKLSGRALWKSARKGYECLFVLRFFPNEVFPLEPEHWTALLAVRRILLNWIREGIRLNPSMQERLQPLLQDFYAANIGKDLPPWRPEYERSCLWVLYRRLPADPQAFEDGLNAYTESDAQKAKFCRTMLFEYQRSNDRTAYQRSLGIVIHWFLGTRLNLLPKPRRNVCWNTLCSIESSRPLLFNGGQHAIDLVRNGSTKGGISVTEYSVNIEDWMFLILFDLAFRCGSLRHLREIVEGGTR